jgi:hypothetical protein
MINVKIECPCGQHYEFEVEPVNGRMASMVACPVCGTDGTETANTIIAGKLSSVRPPVHIPKVQLAAALPETNQESSVADHRVTAVPRKVQIDARALGLVNRETAETEARAKISWGDSQDDVVKYLMLQSYSADEASHLVKVLFNERLVALRVKGVKKIVTGLGMICVPLIAYSICHHNKILPLKLLGLAFGIGAWGFWKALNGLFTVAAPKMERGDVAE